MWNVYLLVIDFVAGLDILPVVRDPGGSPGHAAVRIQHRSDQRARAKH